MTHVAVTPRPRPFSFTAGPRRPWRTLQSRSSAVNTACSATRANSSAQHVSKGTAEKTTAGGGGGGGGGWGGEIISKGEHTAHKYMYIYIKGSGLLWRAKECLFKQKSRLVASWAAAVHSSGKCHVREKHHPTHNIRPRRHCAQQKAQLAPGRMIKHSVK